MAKSSWWSGSESSLQTKTIVDPEKYRVAHPLSAYLESEIGKGLPRYTEGPMYAEFGDSAESRYSEFLDLNPAEWFQKNVSDPTFAEWEEVGVPLLEEGYAGSLRGSGRYRSVEDSASKLTKDLATIGGQLVPEIYQKQLAEARSYKAMKDADYARDYEDWYKSLPSMNPNLNRALQFLAGPTGVDTLAWMQPGTKGILGDLLGMLGSAGSLAGGGTAAAGAAGTAGAAAGATGGAAAGGGAALTAVLASDSRLKKNIVKIGELMGFNMYKWQWKDWAKKLVGNAPHVGVIAQEVNPEAVVRGAHGFLMVDYSKLGGV